MPDQVPIPAITPWNNAFSGIGGGAGVGISGGVNPPNPAILSESLARGMSMAGQGAQIALERQQLSQRNQLFPFELKQQQAQAAAAGVEAYQKQIDLQQNIAFSKILQQNTDPQTGVPNVNAAVTAAAQDPNMITKMPEIVAWGISTRGLNAESVAKELAAREGQFRAISQALAPIIEGKINNGQDAKLEDVTGVMGNLVAQGVIPLSVAKQYATMLSTPGPGLNAQITMAYKQFSGQAEAASSAIGQLMPKDVPVPGSPALTQPAKLLPQLGPDGVERVGLVPVSENVAPPKLDEHTLAAMNDEQKFAARVPGAKDPTTGATWDNNNNIITPGGHKIPSLSQLTPEANQAYTQSMQGFQQAASEAQDTAQQLQRNMPFVLDAEKVFDAISNHDASYDAREFIARWLQAAHRDDLATSVLGGGSYSDAQRLAVDVIHNRLSAFKNMDVPMKQFTATDAALTDQMTFSGDMNPQTFHTAVNFIKKAYVVAQARNHFYAMQQQKFVKDPRIPISDGLMPNMIPQQFANKVARNGYNQTAAQLMPYYPEISGGQPSGQ